MPMRSSIVPDGHAWICGRCWAGNHEICDDDYCACIDDAHYTEAERDA